jgi:hypothetical protein
MLQMQNNKNSITNLSLKNVKIFKHVGSLVFQLMSAKKQWYSQYLKRAAKQNSPSTEA